MRNMKLMGVVAAILLIAGCSSAPAEVAEPTVTSTASPTVEAPAAEPVDGEELFLRQLAAQDRLFDYSPDDLVLDWGASACSILSVVDRSSAVTLFAATEEFSAERSDMIVTAAAQHLCEEE